MTTTVAETLRSIARYPPTHDPGNMPLIGCSRENGSKAREHGNSTACLQWQVALLPGTMRTHIFLMQDVYERHPPHSSGTDMATSTTSPSAHHQMRSSVTPRFLNPLDDVVRRWFTSLSNDPGLHVVRLSTGHCKQFWTRRCPAVRRQDLTTLHFM